MILTSAGRRVRWVKAQTGTLNEGALNVLNVFIHLPHVKQKESNK